MQRHCPKPRLSAQMCECDCYAHSQVQSCYFCLPWCISLSAVCCIAVLFCCTSTCVCNDSHDTAKTCLLTSDNRSVIPHLTSQTQECWNISPIQERVLLFSGISEVSFALWNGRFRIKIDVLGLKGACDTMYELENAGLVVLQDLWLPNRAGGPSGA